MIPPLTNRQIDFSLVFPFLFLEASLRTLYLHSDPSAWSCIPYGHAITTDRNTNQQHLPCFPFLLLAVSAVGGMATVPAGEGRCSPDPPAHLQGNSYSAFTPLPVAFDFLYLLSLFPSCTKFSIRHLFLFFDSHIFSRLSGRPRQEQTKEMMNENRQKSDF